MKSEPEAKHLHSLRLCCTSMALDYGKQAFSLIGVDNSLLEANGRGGLEGRGREVVWGALGICRAGALNSPMWWPKAPSECHL